MKRRYLLAVVAGVAALAAPRPSAQQVRTVGPPNAAPHAVDFLAVSRDDSRTPILDLTREDVTLKVGGKNRVIRSLQLVRMDGPAPAAALPGGPKSEPAFPAPFATNIGLDSCGHSRRVLFVIDTESIRPGQEGPLRAAVTGFLARLAPRDQVGVVAVPHGGMNVEMTPQLDRVRDALNQFTGAGPASQTPDMASAGSSQSMLALTGMLRAMSGSECPSTIIYIASSLVTPEGNQSFDTLNLVRETVGAARAQVFAVQIEGGAVIQGASPGTTSQGLTSLASQGGGEFFNHLALGEEDAIARIGRETSAYYVATFDADPSDRFNTRYPIALGSSRTDVRFLVRPDYERTKSSASTKAPAPGDMLDSPDAFRDLPMRVVGYSVRPVGPDRNRLIWVRASAEIVAARATPTAASAALFDVTGQVIARYDLSAADLAKPVLQPVLEAPPGRYRLRIAATDGKTSGAVDCPVEVGLTPAGSLKISSLMIGPKMLFGGEAEALAVFEIYGQNTGQQLDIDVTLAGGGAKPRPLEWEITAAPPEPDKYIVQIPVPLTDLPPGDYQVRVTVGVVGGPRGTITATVRKVK